jgi:hypothetical protein
METCQSDGIESPIQISPCLAIIESVFENGRPAAVPPFCSRSAACVVPLVSARTQTSPAHRYTRLSVIFACRDADISPLAGRLRFTQRAPAITETIEIHSELFSQFGRAPA